MAEIRNYKNEHLGVLIGKHDIGRKFIEWERSGTRREKNL